MISRGDLTDEEWAMQEPPLPVSGNRCGRWRSHRQVINGIIHRLSTEVQRRDLPQRFSRGRPSTSGTCCGRRTAPGTGSCSMSRPSPTPQGTSTGTSTQYVPTSMPPEHPSTAHSSRRAL
ncbi:transposase [Nonomuraea sp. NPDC049714]|uniref:transposase n=1 Tax=Nonomuraea sp. NPDC049714 TaxID=3364357 RepID=UPI0037BB90F7